MKIISFLCKLFIFLVLTGAVLVVLFVRVPDRTGKDREEAASGESRNIDNLKAEEITRPNQQEGGEALPDGEGYAESSAEGPAVAEAQPDKEMFLTAEDISSMEDLSLGEKLTGLAILSKLQRDVINRIYTMARDGITANEAEDIECLLEENLDREDIDALRAMLGKDETIK